MSQYTVFYNSDKEIEMVLNGQADSATISAQEGTGLSTLVVDVDDCRPPRPPGSSRRPGCRP